MWKKEKSKRIEFETSMKLFEGERWLVMTGLMGCILAAVIGIYIIVRGPIISPEGNMSKAFSFNAAIGIFILSIAAILPLARFGERQRTRVRWFFILACLYSYTIETIQNFRGINPRFTREGSIVDSIAGMFFGVVSLVLVVLMVILTIRFFRIKSPYDRPLLLVGIRYAFLSVIVSNIAGISMILLQSRFIGEDGNFIILHGLGFHALQTLIFPAWILERVKIKDNIKKTLVHFGSISWIFMLVLIGIQTGLGHSVFELTVLPIMASFLFLIWFGTVKITFVLFIKESRADSLPADQHT